MRQWLALGLVLPLLGCGDDGGPAVDFGGEELGPDRHAIVSEDGGAKTGLTDRYVYFGLSDATVEKARSEMRAGLRSDTGQEGSPGFVGGLVERTVGRALRFRAKLPVEEIEDIHWEDGRMRIDFVDPGELGPNFRVNDEPVTDAFAEEDVRAFAEALHRLKAERR